MSLDEDDKEHHRKFMLKPLTPILNRLDDPLSPVAARAALRSVVSILSGSVQGQG
jgi:hypothetical protein